MTASSSQDKTLQGNNVMSVDFIDLIQIRFQIDVLNNKTSFPNYFNNLKLEIEKQDLLHKNLVYQEALYNRKDSPTAPTRTPLPTTPLYIYTKISVAAIVSIWMYWK